MNDKNEIWLITTKGCFGCKIAKNLIQEAISKSKINNIEFIESDISADIREHFKEYSFRDFPVTLFVKNNNIIHSFSGTKPAIVIAKNIDDNF